MKYGDQSDGVSSDSSPSEDNLDSKDMAELMPVKIKPKPILTKAKSFKRKKSF